MPINLAVKLKLKMRKVYATLPHCQANALGRLPAVSIFMHILYAYCKLLSSHAPRSSFRPSTQRSSKARGAHKCCGIFFWPLLSMWTLSKFHVRNRHKSYGHILNLCAPLSNHSANHPTHSAHTAAVLCGLDYLVRATSVEAAVGLCYWFLLAVAYWICFVLAGQKVF